MNMRFAISAEEKLENTLRYLANVESLNSLKYQFREYETAIGKYIVPVWEAIYNVLAPDYMKHPSTKEESKHIIDQTNNRWEFPNCYVGADGKHSGIIYPKYSRSQFYNYKGICSIMLFVFVDYGYKFLIAKIGC